MREPRLRNVCFTLYDSDNSWKFSEVFSENSIFTYAIAQLERCPESGRYHYQGYCELNNPTSLRSIKEALHSDTVHLERRRGTAKQAIDYCSKEETRAADPETFGTPSSQGKRTDLDTCAELIRTGATLNDIASYHPKEFIRYHRGFQALQSSLHSVRRSWKTTALWFFGSTGSGKTRLAYDIDPDAYFKNASDGWWNFYSLQNTVIIDDLKSFKDMGGFGFFLNLLDRYPLLVQQKGAVVEFSARLIIITSSSSPRDVCASSSFHGEDPKQLLRRLEEVFDFDDPVLDKEGILDKYGTCKRREDEGAD